MHEIAGANHYYSGGPDQRGTISPKAVGIGLTGDDWLHRHGTAVRHGGQKTPPGRFCSGRRGSGDSTGAGRDPGVWRSAPDLGPFAGRLLGDMGAEVIRSSRPAPDPLRTWGQAELDGHHFFWTVRAQQEKAVTLNLREPGPGTVPRTRRALRHHRGELPARHPGEVEPGLRRSAPTQPGIILVGCPAGQTGPDAGKGLRVGRRGRERAAAHERFPRRPPRWPRVLLGDTLAGMFAAAGALAALYRRTVTGEGQVVDPALTEILPGRAGIHHPGLRRRRRGARPSEPGWKALRRRTSTAAPTAAGW